MEEVDKIIIHSLKDIGCEIDEDVKSLGQFSTDLIVEAGVKCLEVIRPNLGIPMQLPQNMAARFHVGASLAGACKDLGYNGEVGYQTFLYSNVTEVRRVFMFLIEKLPKDLEKSVIEPDDPFTKLKNEIGKAIKEQLACRLKPIDEKNMPFLSLPLETGITLPGQKMSQTPQEWREYCRKELAFLTDQVPFEHIFPSVISLNSRGLMEKTAGRSRDVTPSEVPALPLSSSSTLKGRKPQLREENTPPNTWLQLRENLLAPEPDKKIKKPVPLPRERREPEEKLNEPCEKQDEILEDVNVIRGRLEDLQSSIKAITIQIKNAEEARRSEEGAMKDKWREVEARRKARELLPEVGSSLKKLEELVERGTQRLVALALEWERHRRPLVERYRSRRRLITHKANESEKQMETVRDLRDKLEVLNKQIALKESMKCKLQEEYDKLPKDINRSAYTRRIMEIIGNIKKQREEIDKILKDTRELPKEINSVMGRLDRAYTVTDEVIFRNAKRDEASRKAYKLLITLHSDCSDIVSMVQETGSIIREIRDLEEQIDIESSKNIGANLERITADLQQMTTENASLKSQLKQLTGT